MFKIFKDINLASNIVDGCTKDKILNITFKDFRISWSKFVHLKKIKSQDQVEKRDMGGE